MLCINVFIITGLISPAVATYCSSVTQCSYLFASEIVKYCIKIPLMKLSHIIWYARLKCSFFSFVRAIHSHWSRILSASKPSIWENKSYPEPLLEPMNGIANRAGICQVGEKSYLAVSYMPWKIEPNAVILQYFTSLATFPLRSLNIWWCAAAPACAGTLTQVTAL